MAVKKTLLKKNVVQVNENLFSNSARFAKSIEFFDLDNEKKESYVSYPNEAELSYR
jgi:hypothetical protein